MPLTLTAKQLELRQRSNRLTREIEAFEPPCEVAGRLALGSLARIRELTLAAALNAINIPAAWGGQGLTVHKQVIARYMRESPVERLDREIRVDRIWREPGRSSG